MSSIPVPKTTQAVSASTSLIKIAAWDGTSQDIKQVLTSAFDATDYLDCIKNLRERNIDPLSYINNLDKIINSLRGDPGLQKRCIRALRKTCGIYGILPTSYVAPFALTIKPGQRPFGAGKFSDVWKITDEKNQDQVFAVKCLRVYQVDPIEKINKKYCKEVIVCKQMNHPNVLSIEGVAPRPFEFCVVSRWMVNGSILDYVKEHVGANRLELLVGVARGLNYLHENNVVHGYLKSVIRSNILVDDKGSARISDFWLSSVARNMSWESVIASSSQDCTIRYCAPELLNFVNAANNAEWKPTNKSDVYSLSMVVVGLVTGKMPFPNLMDLNVPVMILKGKRPSKPKRFEAPGITPAVWKIAQKCWCQKAKERPEAKEALRYLENILYDSEEQVLSSFK